MQLNLRKDIGIGYKSSSQRARVVTENWVADNMFCPRCGNDRISQFENNRPVADFFCSKCGSQYELKSRQGPRLDIVADGAYSTMLKRITSMDNPDFLFMSYSRDEWIVQNFFFVPKHFFTPKIIDKRNPLSPGSRRAGWVGCNIILKAIPQKGKIPIIEAGSICGRDEVMQKVSVADALRVNDIDGRGWLFDVLSCVDLIEGESFTLAEMYSFESKLAEQHPGNSNVRAKIRQQLQFLRDKGVIEFTGRGKYRKML